MTLAELGASLILFVGCCRAVLHDEARYPSADRFKPERYLKEDGSLSPAAPDPMEAAFGYDRRICPGRHLAISCVWPITMVVWIFELNSPLDEGGIPSKPPGEYSPGVLL